MYSEKRKALAPSCIMVQAFDTRKTVQAVRVVSQVLPKWLLQLVPPPSTTRYQLLPARLAVSVVVWALLLQPLSRHRRLRQGTSHRSSTATTVVNQTTAAAQVAWCEGCCSRQYIFFPRQIFPSEAPPKRFCIVAHGGVFAGSRSTASPPTFL